MDQSILKATLRTQMCQRVRSIPHEEAHRQSLLACERLLATRFFKAARVVMLYLPTVDEVDVASIALRCFQTGVTVCAPRIDWEHRRMAPMEITGFDDAFEVRRHGVPEPQGGKPIPPDELDLVVTPGVAFDSSGWRLGRGGGFYDRFLAGAGLRSRAIKCGIGFDCQIIDEAPRDKHDVRLDAVVTDRRTIKVPCAKSV